MAVQAALTGHLVFSTLHTNDAPSAVSRLMELGVPPYSAQRHLAGGAGTALGACAVPAVQGSRDARPTREMRWPGDEPLEAPGRIQALPARGL